jgi:hypothetical protein
LSGVYWKMSTDLSRPLLPSMGLHDALDGFITFRKAQHAIAKTPTNARVPDLSPATESLSGLCQSRNWTTDDPLGLGGLLFDACRLCWLIDEDRLGDVRLLQDVLGACRDGLTVFLASRHLNRPASHRLAFRELGLAIGLRGLVIIAGAVTKDKTRFGPALRRTADQLLPYESLSEDVINAWLPHAQHQDESWQVHQNINDVMLATALIPDMFLSVGEKAPPNAL